MKIAVASDNKKVSGHFGHCQGFEIYDIKDGNIIGRDFKENPGHRPGFLPVFLKDVGANIIIAGGMGETAQQLFKENNINVVGAQGICDDVVAKYLSGQLQSTGTICTAHEHEGHCNE